MIRMVGLTTKDRYKLILFRSLVDVDEIVDPQTLRSKLLTKDLNRWRKDQI